MNGHHALLFSALLLDPAAPTPAAAPCVSAVARTLPAALRTEIARQNASLDAARVAGDADTLVAHFAADAVFMPEHQPRLVGRARGAAYYRALAARLPIAAFASTTADILPLGDGALEWGRFTVSYRRAGGDIAPPLDGKYMHLWRRQGDGTLRLAAETWGYFKPLADPSSHWFGDLGSGGMPRPPDGPLAAELAALNAANARSVQRHDTSRIDQYARDAVYLPFAEQPQIGLAAIRSHLQPYIEQGRGVAFDQVSVGNDGFEAIDGHVLEYSRFAVRWRSGPAAGVTSGNGMRLWRREPDCSLKIIRQIGTHDYRR